MLKKVIKLILIVIWMGIIFILSSDNSYKSTKKSDFVIIKASETFFGRKLTNFEKIKYTDKFVLIVRKGAHFTIYLILGILLFSFIKEFLGINYKSILIAIFLAFLYACSDEVHQLFVEGRSGEVFDVILDTFSSSIGCLFYYGIYNLRRKLYE